MRGQIKHGFKDLYNVKGNTGTCVPCPEGYWDRALELGLGKGFVGEPVVAGPFFMGSGQAQPEKVTQVLRHMGLPTTGGAMWIWWKSKAEALAAELEWCSVIGFLCYAQFVHNYHHVQS